MQAERRARSNPACHDPPPLAVIAYLVTLELQRRSADAEPGDAKLALPFRLMVCGRGAPHCVHTPPSFWRTVRFGADGEVLALLNRVIGVPLETDAEEIRLKAALWRAAIVPSMVHCGDEPKAGTEHEMTPFPLPIGTVDAGAANQYM